MLGGCPAGVTGAATVARAPVPPTTLGAAGGLAANPKVWICSGNATANGHGAAYRPGKTYPDIDHDDCIEAWTSANKAFEFNAYSAGEHSTRSGSPSVRGTSGNATVTSPPAPYSHGSAESAIPLPHPRTALRVQLHRFGRRARSRGHPQRRRHRHRHRREVARRSRPIEDTFSRRDCASGKPSIGGIGPAASRTSVASSAIAVPTAVAGGASRGAPPDPVPRTVSVRPSAMRRAPAWTTSRPSYRYR